MEDGGEGESDLAFRLGLDRAREDLPVGHVELAVRSQPAATLDAHGEVGVGADDAQLTHRVELPRVCVQLDGDLAPVGNRIVLLADMARGVDEVLVLGQ